MQRDVEVSAFPLFCLHSVNWSIHGFDLKVVLFMLRLKWKLLIELELSWDLCGSPRQTGQLHFCKLAWQSFKLPLAPIGSRMLAFLRRLSSPLKGRS